MLQVPADRDPAYREVLMRYFAHPPEVRPDMRWEATEAAMLRLAQVRDGSGRSIATRTGNWPDAAWTLIGKPVDLVDAIDDPLGYQLYEPEERAQDARGALAVERLARRAERDPVARAALSRLLAALDRHEAYRASIYERHRKQLGGDA